MTFATTIAWMVSSSEFVGFILTLPIFMIAAFLSSYLIPKGSVRYLGLLPLLTIFIILPITTLNLVVLIPAIFLMIYNLPSTLETDRRSNYQATFRLFIRIFLGLVILTALTLFILITTPVVITTYPDMTTFTTEVLVFALAFLVNSVIYMRMVRHDIVVQRQRRFQIINGVPVIGCVAFSIIFSIGNQWLFQFFRMLIDGFLFLVSIPAVWLARLISLPFRTLDSPFWDFARDFFSNMEVVEPGEEVVNYYQYYQLYSPAENNGFFIILGISIIIGIILLYRQLMKNKTVAITVDNGLEEERFGLTSSDRLLKNKRNQNQIRIVYQRLLKLLKRKNIQITDSMTSLDVESLVAKNANPTTTAELRLEYVRVRYRESEYTKADVTRVKGLYKKIKEDIEK